MARPKIKKINHRSSLANANLISDDLVVIGKIVKTVGLKGWLKVNILTDSLDRFGEGEVLTVRRANNSLERWKVLRTKPHFTGTRIDILFDGIADCDEASDLVSCYLVIRKSERAKLPEGSFYNDELEGMSVFSGGLSVGTVVRLESEVPSPYIDIDAGEMGEVMVPFRKEFIDSISRDEQKVILKHDITFHIPRN